MLTIHKGSCEDGGMNTITHGQHVAILDPTSGAGLLTSPASVDPDEWTQTMRDLHSSGWEPLTDEWDLPIVVSTLDNGYTAYGLQAYNSADRSADGDYDTSILGLLARLGV